MGFHLANIDQWWFWVLLPAVIILPFLIRLERGRVRKLLEQTFGSVMAFRLTSSLSDRRRLLKNALMIGGLLLAVLAVGRPQWGRKIDEPRTDELEVVLAIDLSLSMLAEDLRPDRLTVAKELAGQLVEALPGSRFALVSFAGESFLELPLTRDRQTVLRAIEDFSPGTIPVQGTNIEAALRESQNAFTPDAEDDSIQAVVIFSDGEELQGDAERQAKLMSREGIPIFSVGLGRPRTESLVRDEGGEFILDDEGEPVTTVLDESLLRELAAITGGAYFHGPLSEGMLFNLARDIEGARVRMEEEKEGKAGMYPGRAERYQIPLVLAVLFWLASFFISERRPSTGRRLGTCLLVAGGTIMTSGFSHSADGKEEGEPLIVRNDKREHAEGLERAQPELEKELERLRGNLARVSLLEETGRVYLEIGRAHQTLGELETAAAAYRSAISHFEGNTRLLALSLWHLGVTEHLLARRIFSEKPRRSAEWFAAARQRYIEAMIVLGSSPRLAWNYEILLREQSVLDRVLSQLLEEEEAKEEPLLSLDEIEELELEPEELERLEKEIAAEPELETAPEKLADWLESDEEEVEAPFPEEAELTTDAPPVELEDGEEITVDPEWELGEREVEAALERARAREKNFRETLKQIRFRDVTEPDRQW